MPNTTVTANEPSQKKQSQKPTPSSKSPIGLLDWLSSRPWRGLVFAVFFCSLAPLVTFVFRGFAPALLFLLLAVPWTELRSRLPAINGAFFSRPVTQFWVATAGFFLWAALSGAWSAAPERWPWGLRLGGAMALAGLSLQAALALPRRDRALAEKVLVYAVFAAAALAAVETASGLKLRAILPPFEPPIRDNIQLGRGVLVLMVIIWPAVVVALRRRRLAPFAFGAVALAAVPAFGLVIQANAVMLVLGAGAFLVGLKAPRAGLAAVFAAMVFMLWASPALVGSLPLSETADTWTEGPASWRQRLYIWERAGGEIYSQPLFGGGIGYARVLSRSGPTVPIDGFDLSTMPMHPHSLFLHIWLELGLVGAVLFTSVLVSLYRICRRYFATRDSAPAAVAIAMAFLVSALAEWELWQVWRLGAVWVAAIAVIVCSAPLGTGDRRR
ncbi:MAG: O-antigen ligase family protein [Pseudomonadota bacterium]